MTENRSQSRAARFTRRPEARHLAILFATVVLFVWNRVAVEIVALGAALALYATGILRLDHCSRLPILTMLMVAGLTALISLNGAVAALLPVVILKAIRRGPPSRLLMPMVFAAHAGSLLTMTGSPMNVLMADIAAETTGLGFSFFEFAIMECRCCLAPSRLSSPWASDCFHTGTRGRFRPT